MPLLKTINSMEQTVEKPVLKSVNDLVVGITSDILKESPLLVAEVESGAIEKRVLETAVVKILDRHKYSAGISRDELISKVFDYMFGYWELEKYIKDEEITDIIGSRYDYFIAIRNGKRELIPIKFRDEQQFESFCKLLAIRNGGILNENDSHCRVADEKNRLRINVSIRPRNITGPALNIRKHRHKSYTLEELKAIGMIDDNLVRFFKKAALDGSSVVFCGKGAAGKTTLLRAMLNVFNPDERVLICESDPELYPDNPNFIVQRIKKANEGGRPVTLRDLVRDGLTMSLDTYCVGEIVGDEAWEFLKAGFTGHRVLATIHAKSAEDTFFRLLTLIKSANVDHSEKILRRMLAACLDYVVFLKDFKVQEVIKITGYDEGKDAIITEEALDNPERKPSNNE